MIRDATTCYGIIGMESERALGASLADAGAFAVLVFAEDRGRSLPQVEVAGLDPWFDVAEVNRAFEQLLGLRTTVLRCLEGDVNTRRADVRIYGMAAHDPHWKLPPGASWVTRANLDAAPFTVPEHRAVIASWLDEAGGLGTPRRAPWTRMGWLPKVEAFITAELAQRGLIATAPIEQLRTWQRSVVLRVPTKAGNLIFKGSPAMFDHEPRVTQLLAQRHPGRFPEVLAIDGCERWTLMRELEGRTLLQTPDLERWADALRAFAGLQVAAVADVDELERSGCPKWPRERFMDRVTPLLRDTRSMLIGTPHGLSEHEARELLSLEPQLRAIIDELFEHGLPLSLEHGDFRPTHVVVGADGYQFFDLSDSAVTHPFFSAVTLIDFEEIPTEGMTETGAQALLRDAYLEAWTGYAPMARLTHAFELARVVAILYAALYRYDIVLPHIEPKENWEFMIPYWQRKLVQALRKPAEVQPW